MNASVGRSALATYAAAAVARPHESRCTRAARASRSAASARSTDPAPIVSLERGADAGRHGPPVTHDGRAAHAEVGEQVRRRRRGGRGRPRRRRPVVPDGPLRRPPPRPGRWCAPASASQTAEAVEKASRFTARAARTGSGSSIRLTGATRRAAVTTRSATADARPDDDDLDRVEPLELGRGGAREPVGAGQEHHPVPCRGGRDGGPTQVEGVVGDEVDHRDGCPGADARPAGGHRQRMAVGRPAAGARWARPRRRAPAAPRWG